MEGTAKTGQWVWDAVRAEMMVPDIAMATSGGKMEFWEEVGWKFVFPSRHPRGGIKVTEPDEIT